MSGMSREFNELVRAIGDCKSKQEEDQIVAKEVVTLRARLADRDAASRYVQLWYFPWLSGTHLPVRKLLQI